jgi:hypothetical protein
MPNWLYVVLGIVCIPLAGCLDVETINKKEREIRKANQKLYDHYHPLQPVAALAGEGGGPIWYQDSETGCEYFGGYGRGITPRMGADGKQICRKSSTPAN